MFRKDKLGDAGENRIRLIEGLTSFIWEIVDMYHQGVGPGAHEPMSPALAKAMIADEINRQLGGPLLAQEWRHVRLRVSGGSSGADSTTILRALQDAAANRVLTLRWVGAREREDDSVVYATIKCSTTEDLLDIICKLEEEGLEVRDGTFGLFVR